MSEDQLKNFSVYEYDDESPKMYKSYNITALTIDDAVQIYKSQFMSEPDIQTETYNDNKPYSVLIFRASKIYSNEDGHEITQEEYNNNPNIDYLNDGNYYDVNHYTEIEDDEKINEDDV